VQIQGSLLKILMSQVESIVRSGFKMPFKADQSRGPVLKIFSLVPREGDEWRDAKKKA